MLKYLWPVVLLILLFSRIAHADVPVADITPEDLLTATLTINDVQKIFPKTEIWWPAMPEFMGGIDPAPGECFFVTQSYTLVGSSDGKIQNALTLYKDDAAAKQDYAGLLSTNDKGASIIEGPALGDESRYFTRGENNSKSITLRFRQGPIVCRMTVISAPTNTDPAALYKLASPVIQRIKWLLSGKLKARPIPAEASALIPRAQASEVIGTVRGTAAIPVESWAAIDDLNDPLQVRDKLRSGGVKQLLLRRYGLSAKSDQVAEVILFEFPDSQSASDFASRTINTLSPEEKLLNHGKTGGQSVFLYDKENSLYELQFAVGRFVADVAAWSPFNETSPVCEGPVRKLAEMWYKSLSKN